MIINCPCGKKRFEVNSSLIPDKGREIQCGSCNHIWFYTPSLESSSEVLPEQNTENNNQLIPVKQKKEHDTESQEQDEYDGEGKFNDKEINSKVEKIKKIKNTNNFKFINILFYFIVSIISFIAMIIVLDTFKSPLSVFFPNIELILYNLFETIKDIYLFIKNLLV